jgi:MFS family permease
MPTTSTQNTVGYKVLYRHHVLILLSLRFLPTTFYGVMSLLPLIIKHVSNDNATVALYITGSSIFASITQLIAGRAADKFGIKLPAQLGFVAILIAASGFVLIGDALWSLFVFGFIGLGAAWALATLLPSMVTRAVEPDIRGRVFGSLHLVWTIAMALGALIGGNFIEINFALPFLVVGALNLLALGLTIPFFQMTARKSHTPI